MQQKTSMCVWLAGLLSLPISGLLELPVRAADDAPKQVAKTKEEPAAAEAVPAQDDKAKADEPKDKAARAKANEDAKAALGALINLAVGAAKARPANVQGLRVNEVQVNEAQLKQFEQQYGRHFQQLFRTEMHFIRMVCKPTKLTASCCETSGRPGMPAKARTRTPSKPVSSFDRGAPF